MKPIIDVKNLTIQYEDQTILKDIAFSVKKGDVFVITGPSGCGKTSLLNHMIGLQAPKKGVIEINGTNIVNASDTGKMQLLKDIGVMYQSGALFGSFNLLENVSLPLEEWTNLPPSAIEAIALNKLKMVDLLEAAYKLPSQISGGMKKRAAIARAMALDPSVLFLDEPAAGLDPITRSALDKLILQLANTLNLTFVIVTHEISTIMTIANNMIMLHDNKIIANGHPDTLRKIEHAFVKDFFEKGLIERYE